MTKKKKVVVVDDSQLVLELTRETLEGNGYDVVCVSSPIGANLVIHRERPDLVLMDINMASLSGELLIGGLKRKHSSIFVLVYSDRGEAELKAITKRTGADGYVCKTADEAVLLQQIQRWTA